MKKICFITTIPNTIKGFILEFAKYMHDNTDYDITFVCDYDKEFAELLPEYINYIPIKMKRGVSFGGIKAFAKMVKVFHNEKFDMIQYSTPNASLYASLAGFIAHIPIRLYCQWGLAFIGFNGLKRQIFKAIEKTVCKLSTWIEPDSYGNLDFCHANKLYPYNKGSVVNKGSASGVSLDKFDVKMKYEYRNEIRNQWELKDTEFVYGFVGSITGDKGINELIASFKEISNKHKNVRLLLVGGVDKEYSIDKSLLEWSQKSEFVTYCGSTPNVEKYMATFDCYVMPSYREGFGLTVVEAGSMAIPVITTNIPGPTDAIKDGFNGLVVPKKDKVALQKAMLTMYNNKDLCIKYGNNGLKNVQENYEQKNLFKFILNDRIGLLNNNC